MDELIERLKTEYKDGTKLVIHHCSFCEWPCGYSWLGGKLHYDTGCSCTSGRGGFQPRDEADLRQFLEKNPEWVKKNCA